MWERKKQVHLYTGSIHLWVRTAECEVRERDEAVYSTTKNYLYSNARTQIQSPA